MKQLIFVLSIALLTFSSCDKKKEVQPSIQAITVKNLPADPPTGYDQSTGVATGATGKHYLLDIKTGNKVDNADSASTKWHFGFRGTAIIVNGGTSGPGGCQAQLVNGIFDTYKSAPTDGYKSDNETASAINGWYNYDMNAHVISPKAGVIILLKTGEGRYAKMEITSYYKDAPANPTMKSEARYYTLRYVYQPNNDTAFQ